MASYFLCCFLLQLSFGAIVTGTEMLAFSGMSFPLFSKLTLHKLIRLYKNGNKNNELIVRWETGNATFVKPIYRGKIYLYTEDIDKTQIWICNVDQTHSAKYIVKYDSTITETEVELTIMENKQLDVCLNSPPNSPEKCFGNLTEKQVVQYIEKFLDEHPQYIKRHFGNLTEDEVQKWLDSNPGFMKKYFGNLTEDEVQKWLDSNPGFMKKYFGSCESFIITLQIVIVSLTIITCICIAVIFKVWIRKCLKAGKNWIQEKLGSEHTKPSAKQSSKSHDNTSEVVPIDGSESYGDENYGDLQSVVRIDWNTAQKGDKAQTGSLDQSGKWMKNYTDSDDEEQPANPLMPTLSDL